MVDGSLTRRSRLFDHACSVLTGTVEWELAVSMVRSAAVCAVFTLALALLPLSVAGEQPGRVYRIGLLMGATLIAAEVRTDDDLERAFTRMKRERAQGAVVVIDTLALSNRGGAMTALAAANRLPVVSPVKDWVIAGGLMSYGIDGLDLQRRAATYIDKILKGAKPGDLPVELPMKYDLVINLKTAKALGVTIPRSLLIRADQVIE